MKPVETMKVLAASVIAVVVMVGIARFSYTPMIPEMVAALGLSTSVVGMLATVNYAGYLTGALLITRISDLGLKVRLYQLGLVVAVVSTLLMGYTTNVWLWFVLRFISGLSTSAGMLLGAGLLMSWLIKHNQKSELGVFFSGIGLGIVLTAVVAELIKDAFAWDAQWVIYGLVALVLLVPAWRWMPDYRACALPQTAVKNAEGGRNRFIRILQLAYFCAGVGYVVTATFLVAIAEAMPQLSGHGWLIWLVVGLAATPACWLWDVFSRRWGQWLALYLAYTLNAVSILMLIVNADMIGVILSAVIYGASFIGIVSMMLAMVGRVFPENPSRPMSRLTFSYGIAQMLAPAVVGYLADVEGNYTNGLWLTLIVMALGVVVLHLARKMEQRGQNAASASSPQ
ncbi:MAG TPA: YbfB/YjiJ family MFS transporter [Marinobacter sp.]